MVHCQHMNKIKQYWLVNIHIKVIIDNMYTRPYMFSEIDSEITIIPRKTESNQSKFIKTRIWKFDITG